MMGLEILISVEATWMMLDLDVQKVSIIMLPSFILWAVKDWDQHFCS